MGLRIEREKPRHLLASVLYRLLKLPVSRSAKFRLFLDLEWIFNRLANEVSEDMFDGTDHVRRGQGLNYILEGIRLEDSVVDLGCGHGEITADVAKKARRVLGVDHRRESIERAQARFQAPNLQFECADVFDYLRTTDDTFDVLILSHVLEHIDGPEAFLNECTKLFKRIYIEVPDFDATILNHYRKDLNLKLRYTDNDHVTEFDRTELLALLRESNITVVRSEYVFGIQRYWCEVV